MAHAMIIIFLICWAPIVQLIHLIVHVVDSTTIIIIMVSCRTLTQAAVHVEEGKVVYMHTIQYAQEEIVVR